MKSDYDILKLIGVKINILTSHELYEKIISIINSNCMDKKIIFTPNVDILVTAESDKDFKKILNAADFNIPDGKPLIWASKFLGEPLKEKISGSSLFFKLCEIASLTDLSFFLLGGAPGVSDKAKKKLEETYPNIHIVGSYSPPFGFENNLTEERKIISLVNEVSPDILVLGFGAPKQEKWILKNREQLNFGVALGLGATIDFAAGIKKMPPEFIKTIGFAWLWRLLSEPKRLWKRYLIKDMKFFWYVFQQKFNLRDFNEN